MCFDSILLMNLVIIIYFIEIFASGRFDHYDLNDSKILY